MQGVVPSSRSSTATGPAATPCMTVAKQTGQQPGALTVVVPLTAEAEQMAVALTGLAAAVSAVVALCYGAA